MWVSWIIKQREQNTQGEDSKVNNTINGSHAQVVMEQSVTEISTIMCMQTLKEECCDFFRKIPTEQDVADCYVESNKGVCSMLNPL